MVLSFLNPRGWFNKNQTKTEQLPPKETPNKKQSVEENDGLEVEQEFAPQIVDKEKIKKQSAEQALRISGIDASELYGEYLKQIRDFKNQSATLRAEGLEAAAPYVRDAYLRAAKIADELATTAEALSRNYELLTKDYSADFLAILGVKKDLAVQESKMRALRQRYALARADAQDEAEIAKQVNPRLSAERASLHEQIGNLEKTQDKINTSLTILETQIAKMLNGLFAALRSEKIEKLQTEAKAKELALTKIQKELSWLTDRLQKIAPRNDGLAETAAEQKFFDNESAK